MREESLNFLFTVLNVCSSIIATCASILMCKAAKVQEVLSKNKSKREYAPYLYPEEAWFRKENWIRFYEGIDVPEYILSKRYTELSVEEKRYFDNCKKNENAQKVYFDYLDGETILVANLSKKMPTKLVEHDSTEITFANHGVAAITKLVINSVEIYKLNNVIYRLDGGDNNFYSNIIPSGERITILFDIVTDDINTSTCNISKEVYEGLKDVDNFSYDVEPLQYYSMMIFNLTLENIYNEKFNYQITIEKKDKHLHKQIELIT